MISISRNNLLSNLYYIFIVVYVLGGILTVSLSFIYNFNKEAIGMAFLIGPLIFILYSKVFNGFNINEINYSIHKPTLFKVTLILFLVFSVLSILFFVESMPNYYLSLQFFVTISIIYSIIFIQILCFGELSRLKVLIILLEILIVSGIVSTSFLYLFPDIYGNDSAYHIEFIKNIINTGNVLNYRGYYQNYPTYHLVEASISIITGLKDFKIVHFITLVIQIIFLPLIFILSNKFFNEKIGLISVLLLSIFPHLITSRYTYFPSFFSFIFIILILYLIFSDNKNKMAISILFLITFSSLVITHPLVPVYLLCIALPIFILPMMIQKGKFGITNKANITSTTLLLMLTVIVSMWSRPISQGNELLTNLVNSIKNAFYDVDYTTVGKVTLTQTYSKLDMFFYDLGISFLIVMSIFGALYAIRMLSGKFSELRKTHVMILAIITLLFIPIPYVLTLAYPSSLPERWFPLLGILMAIYGSVGFYLLFNNKATKALKYAVFILLFFTVFFCITNPIANPNNHIYSQELTVRSGLTNSELKTAEFSLNNFDIKNLRGNSKFVSFFPSNITSLNYLKLNKPEFYFDKVIIVRSYDLEEGFTIPLFGHEGKLYDQMLPDEKFFSIINNSDLLYDNGQNYIYWNIGRKSV